jgi:hypothetical protein
MKKKMLEKRAAKYGSLIKTSIKKIGSCYYFTEVFDKSDKGLNFLSFVLKNVEDASKPYTINFNLQDNNLINTQGLDLHDYLTGKLKLGNDN